MNKWQLIILISIISALLAILYLTKTPTTTNSPQRSFHEEVDASSGATKQWRYQKIFENIIVPKDEKVAIIYPFEGSVFPVDFSPASFIWKEYKHTSKQWTVLFKVGSYTHEIKTAETFYKPSSEIWEELKRNSQNQAIQLSVSNNKQTRTLSFKFSNDSVVAPIFYRAVPLPFSYANTYRANLKWYLGDITKNEKRLMLDDMPVCANCHSFTADGKTFGMDVDYANDKGNYTIANIEKTSSISPNNIYSWMDFKGEDGVQTFALLTKLSPDGNFAISTVKDKSIFVPVDKSFWYSQLFFPVKGLLVAYDINNKTFFELKGAADSNFVQSSVAWSPSMKEIIFSRAPYTQDTALDASKNAVLDMQFAKEYINREKDFKFNLFRLPWNNGQGGKPIAIEGAANDGTSNYFARYSPDGKWIVFCKAENFMLLQPDSKLYIMPAEGGTPRLMNCNTNEMNSWHSFSPNSKWLVYSTKYFGPYTQLFLTHIDELGNDTPPIWLEQLTVDMKAANIPEFVNIDYNSWHGIKDNFTDSSDYLMTVIDYNYRVGDLDAIIEYADKKIEENPNHHKGYYIKAKILMDKGEKQQALDYARQAVAIFNELENPNAEDLVDLATSYELLNQNELATKNIQKAIDLDPNNSAAWSALSRLAYANRDYINTLLSFNKLYEITGETNYLIQVADLKIRGRGAYSEAIPDLNKVLELDNCNIGALEMLSECQSKLGDLIAAENTISRMISCEPTQGVSYFARGNFYLNAKKYKRALNDFTEGLKYEKDPMAYYYRALIYYNLKDFKAALKDAKESKRILIAQQENGQIPPQLENIIKSCKRQLQ